jgi:actin-related protein
MLAKIDKRVDDEIFNNLSSKAYFKGLIMLHIINHKKELTSKIKTILNEMRVLLSTTQYKDQMNKLEYSYFSKMEQQQDYDDFNRMFEEYLKLKGVRLDEIKQRQEEEERKRKEREEKERQILEEQRKKKGNLMSILLIALLTVFLNSNINL